MSAYSGPPSVNPYWYYDPHGYQPNVSVSFNTNISVNTPPHPSFDMYHNSSNNNNNTSGFADSGYLSRTPTPPTPSRIPSPQPLSMRQELEKKETDSRLSEKSFVDSKPRLPYVKRTRIQYTNQQLQILEEAFDDNHYPEVTTVDALAEMLDVRHEKISIWFQNRRSRYKRQQKPKSSSSSNEAIKRITHSIPVSSAVPSQSYDSPTSYYSPYFWPSPIADNRTATSYTGNPHVPTFYDSNASPMWNTNNNAAYLSSTQWHQSSCSMNLSSSPSSPCTSILPEHLPSM
ncbi:unnamed protein product [Rotaria socialis]|uniref:Homeobox domain-containing protein n=1 Tax=Rotaria socialis TaxID=392032 RepID=A0A818A8A7_9BILA|nr:unnamed protein product [Rotaria socialis]CAF3402689.1 unnamed protein product [Rotaria socialis]CAF3469596.1 unnamed protein product [Rotaria socialis]CAF3545021.1 unnamed protein product [Rotaria socialis]CAF3619299.1 unnamed protein product [Rotaria socialis]